MDVLTFFVNGKKITDANPDPEDTLLQYLRRKLLLPGTKEGCGHGGCGSCTVMVSKYDVISQNILEWNTFGKKCDHPTIVSKYDFSQKIIHYTVNACIFPLCATHGLAITTVEGVGNPNTGLHKLQQTLVEKHGLQCGFCTPGFVMSAFTLLRNNPQPSRDEFEQALEGNLCRCTGYRGIMSAFDTFTKEGCAIGEDCCRNTKGRMNLNQDTKQKQPDNNTDTQVPIFPPELQLNPGSFSSTVKFIGKKYTWISPSSLQELVELKHDYCRSPVIMGNTTTALQLKQGQFSSSPVLLYGCNVPELKTTLPTDHGIQFGAALTLNDVKTNIQTIRNGKQDQKFAHLDSILDMIRYYGSDQIRNVATLSGSILSGRSNSDVTTLLLALNTSVINNSVDGERTQPLHEINVGQTEVVTTVFIPNTEQREYCRFYKQSDRRTFSLAIINSAMFLGLSQENKVNKLRLSFGGVTEKPLLLTKSAELAIGRPWDEPLLKDVLTSLTEELVTLSGGRDVSYKVSVATGFFYKFFTDVRNKITQYNGSQSSLLTPVPLPPVKSSQYFDPCTDPDQTDSDALGRPIPNVSSESIVSGEALFIDDIPKQHGELFLGLVLSQKAHARIINVDASVAMEMEGIHGYIDYTDIPGENVLGFGKHSEEAIVSKEVQCVGQCIGGVLADTRELAWHAAKLVNVKYEEHKPILTIEEAVKENSFIGDPVVLKCGNIEKGFNESDHVIQGEYSTGFQEHFYMETYGTLVVPKIENNELEVNMTCQTVQGVHLDICRALNLPQNKVTCKVRRIGGGFGGKENRVALVAVPTALAAFKYKKAVRCVLPREIDMMITGKRHPFLAKYKVGFDSRGKIKALQLKMYCNGGISEDTSSMLIKCAVYRFDNCCRLENMDVIGQTCKTNIPSNTSFRGFGGPEGALIMDNILFHVAAVLNTRPEPVIERNFCQEGDLTPYGQKIENCSIQEMWDKCAEQSQFLHRLEEVNNFNRDSRWKKRGITMTAIKFGMGFTAMFVYRGTALVNIYKDGSVLLTHGGIEMGQGLITKLIQVASRELGIPCDKIYTSEAGTNTVADPTFTAGSMGTDLYAPAVYDACRTLKDRLEPIEREFPELSWEQKIEKAFFQRVKLQALGFSRKDKDLDEHGNVKESNTFDYFAYGVACTEVEIDVLTGENQVLQVDIMFDVGKSLNPAIDIGQIEGAFVQGMGMVTTESIDIDQAGRITSCSPLSYKIPNVRSIPRRFNVTLLKNHDYVTTAYSAKGIGEPPYMLAGSVLQAIKMAVMAARLDVGLTGYFRLDSPATVEKIQQACGDQIKEAL